MESCRSDGAGRPRSGSTPNVGCRPAMSDRRLWSATASCSSSHVLPTLGRFQVDRLEPQHVEALLRTKRAAGLSSKTCNHIRTTLRTCLNGRRSPGHRQQKRRCPGPADQAGRPAREHHPHSRPGPLPHPNRPQSSRRSAMAGCPRHRSAPVRTPGPALVRRRPRDQGHPDLQDAAAHSSAPSRTARGVDRASHQDPSVDAHGTAGRHRLEGARAITRRAWRPRRPMRWCSAGPTAAPSAETIFRGVFSGHWRRSTYPRFGFTTCGMPLRRSSRSRGFPWLSPWPCSAIRTRARRWTSTRGSLPNWLAKRPKRWTAS